MRAVGSLLVIAIAFQAGLAAVAPAVAAAGDRYDVSYFWSRDLGGVLGYRERVAAVLGPEVGANLKVVAKGGLFGLIYVRGGDRDGAIMVAGVHSRLLEPRGLEAAQPLRSENWDILGDGGEPPDLEAAVEEYIGGLRREGKIKDDERTAWSVYDFTSGEKLVSINEDEQFEAASMVKPFVAAAFFCRVEKGELIYGLRSRRKMELAIQHSSNAATNWLLRKIGGPTAAERILKRSYPSIFQDTRIVEYIPRGGRTYGNRASPHDYSRFLYALWNGDICGAPEIKRLMALPGPDRIVTGVAGIPTDTPVYNKTGSTARLCGDAGILVVQGPDGKRYPYTLIGIIEKEERARDYSTWIRSRGTVIRDVSRIVYDGMMKRYDDS